MAKPKSLGFQMATNHLRLGQELAARRAADPEAQRRAAAFAERVDKAVAETELPDRIAVEGATVVCTQMYEPESESKMIKTDTSNAELLQGGYKLVHTDIEFEPLFEKCKYDDDDCEPEIDDEEWHEYYENRVSNEGYALLKEKSFMVCKKGFGMLYLSEDGQKPCDMKALLAMLAITMGDRSLLGDVMHAAFSIDPVNLATGNFIFAKTDLEIAGNVPIKFQRFYNTFDKEVRSLGKGWRHPFDIKLKDKDDGVVITFADGHDEVYALGEGDGAQAKKEDDKPKKEEPASDAPKGYFFEMMRKEKEEQQKQKSKKNEKPPEPKGYRLSKPGETLPNKDDKNYDAPDGNFNNLMRIRDNYRLVKSDGTTLHFDKDGYLIKIADQNQVETVLSYDGNKLIKVVGLSGSLAFTYFDSDKIDTDKIATITDHTGRTVSYTYDGDLLTSATDPLGNTRTYSYDEKDRFFSEVNPEGNMTVENEYDDKDRTIIQRFADGSKMQYIYEDREVQNIKETLKTELIEQNGVKTIYYRDIQYRTVEVEYPDHGIIQTEYNWKHQKISETDKIGPRTYYEYNDKGNLTRIENPLGEMTDLIYDEKDRLEIIVSNGVVKLRSEYDNLDNLIMAEDALKRQIRFSYDKKTRGLPTHIVQPDGSVSKVKYDDRRNVVETTDAFGVTNYFEYDTLNRVTKTVDGNGNATQFSYDAGNNITRIINAEGNSQTYEYNKAKKLTKMTDFNGATISFSHNSLNKPSEIIDQLGRVTQFGYNEMWNLNHLKLPNGAENFFIYDKNNRLVTVEKPDGNTIHYEYDKNGNRTKVIDENGNETHLKYDKLQRVIEISNDDNILLSYSYNSDGQITKVTDAMDNVTQFVYNEGGELIQEINALGDSRTYTYTTLGKVQTVTDEVGRVTTYDYEPGGRLKSTIHPDGTSETLTYDNNGNIKTHTNQLGLMTTYVYDCLNRVVEIAGGNGGSKKYSYDQVGNVLSMTNELGYTTNYSYTLTGQLEKVIDSLGNETHYDHDKLDQLIEVRQLGDVDGTDDIDVDLAQANHLNEASRITTYKRNLLGQVTSVTDALGQSEHYEYSPVGQLIRKVDKEGFTTEFGYTSQGDVNHIKYDDGREVHMDYNPLSQLIEVRDWLGTTSIEVDPFGQATKITDHNDNIISYEYGKMGERRSLTYPDGKIVNYHYDNALRLTQIQDGEQFTNYLYDQHSRLIEKQNSNNTSTKYNFNELGQLQSLVHSQSGKSYTGRNFEENFDQFYYEYDRLGNKVEVNRIRKGFESKDHGRYHYQYDELNRLTKVILDRETLRSYEYDGFGNRTRMFEKGNNISYSYNNLNQLISKHDDLGNNFEYVYDHRGNMSEMYKNKNLIHKHYFGTLNRLEATFNYEKNLGGSYSYNGLGNRVSKMQGTSLEATLPTTELEDMKLSPTEQVDNVLDLTRGFNNLLQRSENGETTSFIFDFGVLSSQSKDQTLHYFHDDLGSPIRLINDRGHEQNRFSFDEFGRSVHQNSNDKIIGFTGYEFDNVTEGYSSPSRSYDQKIGRFTSPDNHWSPKNMIWGDPQTYSGVPLPLLGVAPDPLAIGQSSNLYGYTMNNPLAYVDLNGEFIITALAVTAGLAVAGAVIGGGASIASDIGNGRDISWREAGRNALRGAGVGGAIGITFVTGGAMTLAASPVVATIGYGTMAFSGGLGYRAFSDLATSAVSGEVHISSARRYLSSGASATMLYAAFKTDPVGTGVGLLQEAGNNILEGELSSLESYASSAFTSSLTMRFLRNGNIIQNLSAVAGGSALGYGLEWLGGVREFDWNELRNEVAKDISAAALANGANNMFPFVPAEVWEVLMRQFVNYGRSLGRDSGRSLSFPEDGACHND